MQKRPEKSDLSKDGALDTQSRQVSEMVGDGSAAAAASAPEDKPTDGEPADEKPTPDQNSDPGPSQPEAPESKPPMAWERVKLARDAQRPHTAEYLERVFENFQQLHGDRCYGDDPAVVAGYAFFRGRPVMVLGQEKGRDTKARMYHNFGMPKPEGYRKALRVMRLAAKFGRPIITLLDTPGAYPGIDAEERGQAEAIARNLYEMAEFETPIVSVCIGEGGSGGALGMGVANRVLMFENSVYSVISPESCAAIVWRDATQAEKAAEALKLTSSDLLELGLVDEVIPEPAEGAQNDWDGAAKALGDAIERNLADLALMSGAELVEDRYRKFRQMGGFFQE